MNYLSQFLQYFEHNKGRQPNTISSYESFLSRLTTFLTDHNKTLDTASRYDLEAFTGLHAHNEGLTASSRKPLIAAVRAFYKWMYDQGHVKSNPAQHLSYPRSGRSLPVPISTQSLEKLLASIKLEEFADVRDATMIALLAGTGMRISGLLSLNQSSLQDYERFNDMARVTIRVTEKGAKTRVIPIPDVAMLYLHAYLGHPYLNQVDRRLPNGDKVLFISQQNRHIPAHEYYGEALRLTRKSVHNMIKRRGLALGITPDQLSPHAFRHWYATDLLNKERSLVEIQTLLGHANISTTEIYLHVATDRLIDAVDVSSLNDLQTPMRAIASKIKARPRS